MNTVKFVYCHLPIVPVRSETDHRSEMISQMLFGEIAVIYPRTLVEYAEYGKWWFVKNHIINMGGYVNKEQVRLLTENEVRELSKAVCVPNILTKINTPWGKQNIVRGSVIQINEEDYFRIGKDVFSYLGSWGLNDCDPYDEISDNALHYLNAPYLWGGRTHFGIDCSGLVLMAFQPFDIYLPHNASEQAKYGTKVDFEDRRRNDVAFFQTLNGTIIHVGILISKDKIIHASGHVRIDEFTPQGIWNVERNEYSHSLAFIKRITDGIR